MNIHDLSAQPRARHEGLAVYDSPLRWPLLRLWRWLEQWWRQP